MLVRQVALVPEGVDIDLAEIARVAAALQKQVTRDFSPLWQVNATVDGFASLEDVPSVSAGHPRLRGARGVGVSRRQERSAVCADPGRIELVLDRQPRGPGNARRSLR